MAFYSIWASSRVSIVAQTYFYISLRGGRDSLEVAYVLGDDHSRELEVIKIPTNHRMFMQSITITNTLNEINTHLIIYC